MHNPPFAGARLFANRGYYIEVYPGHPRICDARPLDFSGLFEVVPDGSLDTFEPGTTYRPDRPRVLIRP